VGEAKHTTDRCQTRINSQSFGEKTQMPVIFYKVGSERPDCGAKCREQIHWTI